MIGEPVFRKVFSYTDCLHFVSYFDTLGDALVFLTQDHALVAGVEGKFWSITTPTPEGYRVELFKEED